MIRVNFGCGTSPSEGWINFDNSPAIKLANSPCLFFLAKFLRLLDKEQIKNIEWNKKNKIHFADATKKIHLEVNSVECIYTSHMLEHLSRDEALFFLSESLRILKTEGVLRIAVPDLGIAINNYLTDGDADKFMEKILVQAPPIDSLKKKLQLFFTGYRHHRWMYDGKSLSLLMKNVGFRDVKICINNETLIKNINGLNLQERVGDSVYVEGVK
jgi:predicted SAM-dependent methyltransferase